MNALIGDIGGTKTILAIFSTENGPRLPLAEKTYQSTRYASFESMVSEFLGEVQVQVDRACFGVAGPVLTGRARVTNLPWVVDKAVLKSNFSLSSLKLLNDLESVAYAIPILSADDIHTLNVGVPVPGGSIAVLAPGTGLGEGYLTFNNGVYCAHASEGGHASFAPVGPLQVGLLSYLTARGYNHVSYERVCSGGQGVPHLYSYLKSTGIEEPDWLAEKLAGSKDPTPIIFSAAHDSERPSKLASATVELFVSILGSEAGNLALKILATGGIYLGGGIPPRILTYLQAPAFQDILRSKGRFRQLLANMPLHVIMNSKAGLLGAAAFGLAAQAACQ
jgi:glucokinase